jgi:hypothetical protein
MLSCPTLSGWERRPCGAQFVILSCHLFPRSCVASCNRGREHIILVINNEHSGRSARWVHSRGSLLLGRVK